MHFENSKGFLIGEVGKGLTELFVMMNENRILVSSQSLGVAETAAQFAKGYAKFRVQGHKEIGGIRRQVTISEHPDVMRMILKSDAWLQGLRGVLFSTGMLMDNIQFDKNDVEKSKRRVALMGPVLKALTSNMAIDIALRSQSIMGARGYLEEGQMSQFIRDIRVTQIYEGSNGIQALQFMNARLEGDGGAMIEYLDDERDYVESGVEVANKLFQDEFIVPYSDALSKLNEFVIEKLGKCCSEGCEECLVKAQDFLHVVGYMVVAKSWCEQIHHIFSQNEQYVRDHKNLVIMGKYFMGNVFPEIHFYLNSLISPHKDVLRYEF